jgi:hypothetical protein
MDLKLSPFQTRALGVLLVVAGSVTMLGITGLLLIDRWMRKEYEPALAMLRKDTEGNVDFFCEQQSLLAADPWFREPRPEGDAGPLLNPWMPWDSGPVAKGSPLAIPAHLPQSFLDFQDWLSSKADLSTVDFGWMAQLHAYDRWDFLKNRPIPIREPFDLISEPMPQVGHLILWARLRLLHGLRIGQPLAAARDVRHLAWLVYRTDSLIGAMVAATLLDTERLAHASLKAPPPEWRPMTSEQVARMRAVVTSGYVFSYPHIAVEVAKKSRRCGEPVARCVSMAEAAFMARILEPWARSTYREAYTALEEDLETFPCPSSLGRLLWQSGVTLDNGAADLLPPMPEWMQWLPRTLFGARLANWAVADGNPSLHRLHAFRKALATGDFESDPGP